MFGAAQCFAKQRSKRKGEKREDRIWGSHHQINVTPSKRHPQICMATTARCGGSAVEMLATKGHATGKSDYILIRLEAAGTILPLAVMTQPLGMVTEAVAVKEPMPPMGTVGDNVE